MQYVRALLILLVTSLSTICMAVDLEGGAVVSGLGSLSIAERYQLTSEQLSETREFYLSLPQSYEGSQHHYSVLYLLDADQYLEQIESLSHPVEIDATVRQNMLGCYGAGDEVYEVYLEDGKLYGRHNDWRDFEFFAKTTEQFFMRVPPGYAFSFVEEETGMMLLVDAYGNRSRLAKMQSTCE